MYNKTIFFERLAAAGVTNVELSKAVGVSTGNITDWKTGKSKPKTDVICKIADYLGCSTDYLLGRVEKQTTEGERKMGKEVNMTRIGDAALTMVKKYLKRQLEAHFQTTDIAAIDDFQAAIDTEAPTIIKWFKCSSDYSLNCKVDDMLNILGHKDVWSLLETYVLGVSSPDDVCCLKLPEPKTNQHYPYAVPASVIFDALRPLSMSSLKVLCPSIYSQIIDEESINQILSGKTAAEQAADTAKQISDKQQSKKSH